MRSPIAIACVVLVLACSASGTPEAGSSSSAETTSTSPDTGGSGTSSEGGATTSAMDTSTSEVSTTIMPTTDPETTASDTEPMPPRLCSLEALDPSTDPATVIEYGDEEGQIPTVIGELLLRNCGCHYTDNVMLGPLVDYKSNAQPMATWAHFQGNFTGILPMDFEDMPAHVAVHERVVNMMPLPMPPFQCQVEGEPGMITMADKELLTEWLELAAPDGASFP
jgi:hypothetical protein